jgi:hypothetical protein
MPNEDYGVENQVVTRTSPGILELKSLSELIGGSTITDGTYTNPKITVLGGVITNIVSRPTINLLTTPASIVSRTRQSINPYLWYTYPNITNNNPVTIIASTVLNWTGLSGYDADAKYALLSTKLFLQSNGGDYYVRFTMDDKIIAFGEVREHHTYLGVDSLYDSNQQLFLIPVNKNSVYKFEAYTLPGTTKNNTLNLFELNVTLDGWVY